MIDFTLDRDKAVSSMLYICQTLGGSWDKYSLLKILYFAEQKHLATYGRPITGDNMMAMKYGPVPSVCYDSIKPQNVSHYFFEIDDNVIIAKIEPNLDCFSDSDIECLNEAVKENNHLDFGSLLEKSHDSAYNWTIQNMGLNSTIPYFQIAKAAGATDEMLEYIQSFSENQAADLNVPN